MADLSGKEKVCLIVPLRNLHKKIDKCLDSFFNLDYPNFEIILVDDGLAKKDCETLDKLINKRKIKILKSDGKGPSYARNLGAKNTDAEFIAFADSDCIVDNNWLKELLRSFQVYPEAVACGGIQKLPEDATPFEKKVFFFIQKVGFISEYVSMFKENKIKEVNHNPSCNVMYKKNTFLKENGFLEGLWPAEDVELDYRIKKKGYKIIFNSKAIVYHYRPKRLLSFLRMMYRYGEGQGFLVKRYGIFRKIQVLPFLSLTFFILFLLSVMSYKFLLYILIFMFTGTFLLLIYYNFNFLIFVISLLSFLSWHFGFFKNLLRSK